MGFYNALREKLMTNNMRKKFCKNNKTEMKPTNKKSI